MATLAQMRTPSRIMLRCSGVHVACGHSGESSCMFPSFSLLLSFIRRNRSGGSSGRWPLVTGRWMRRRHGRMGRAPGGVYADSGPAAALARAGRAGQSLKKVIWNPSPKRISSPPGILLANRTREW